MNKLLELNKLYTTKELAEALEITYGCFRNERAKFEKHLSLFYNYVISRKSNNICYTFTEQYDEYITYKEYSRAKKNKILRNNIINVIEKDNRQTGSNIARIISIDGEI